MRQTTTINPNKLTKPTFIGAAIGLILIVVFLSGVKNLNPAWRKLWMAKPLLMVPFAGALGGLFFALMHSLRSQGGWKKVWAHLLSLLIFVIGIFIGFVLGLNGTLWD